MPELKSATESTANWALQRHLALVSEAVTGSTNDDAKANALKERADLVLYLAAHQTKGRGRGTNEWLDTGAGEALLSTWSFRVPSPPQAITGPRIGLALYQAVVKIWPSLRWSLKAPNDLFLEGTKTAGLLVESVTGGSQHRLMIGLGFNVMNHPRRFSEATHLSESLNGRPDEADWFRFLDELRAQFVQAVADATKAKLGDGQRGELVLALNANPARPFDIVEVSPEGDLVHAQGRVRWTDL